MSKVTVMAGPCKFTTEIIATKIDRKTVKLEITSQCPNYKNITEMIPEVNIYEEVSAKLCETNICKNVSEVTKHAACPVTCAILKAVEVEAGLVLPVAPEFTIEK